MESLIKKMLISILIIFGFIYSFYISVYVGDYYVGLIFALITVGFASTIYILDRAITHRIIFYIWLAIVVFAIAVLIVNWSFKTIELFKI